MIQDKCAANRKIKERQTAADAAAEEARRNPIGLWAQIQSLFARRQVAEANVNAANVEPLLQVVYTQAELDKATKAV